ncbi:MAG: 4-(cytidine 5'-diphospho)-2-C-methyl-D-erythritol kinase [Planctomycetaceae bacterium]|nr:4-(cytidine 5'-diphospho)-2-C-methyl-D-erythritol kinase [Planctomycetaceae bacterium]
MFARRKGATWQVFAPAKVNLTLRILGRRNDGFHELETIMSPVALYDRLSFRPAAPGRRRWGFTCSAAPGLPSVPDGPENLVCQALHGLAEAAGVEPHGEFMLHKRIPAAAGLGGGSSDAAAALRLANRAWGLHLPDSRLRPLAESLGSDVPFFLSPGTALCRGRGEQIDRLESAPALPAVIVKPTQGVSTPAAFAALGLRPHDQTPPAALAAPTVAALAAVQSADWMALRRWVRNALQTAAEGLCEQISRIRFACKRLDVVAHCMTGSGSAYFAICRTARHAQRVAARLRAQNLGMVFATATCR